MIPIERREPFDERTPAEVVELVLQRSWASSTSAIAAEVVDALVYKAYSEGSEGALRWLDPDANVLKRIGVRPELIEAADTRQEASKPCRIEWT